MVERQLVNDESGFAAAMMREAGAVSVILPKASPAIVATPARIPDVLLGVADTGQPIGFDLTSLIEGRLLIQGVSGAGKSWTLRRLLEQSHGRVQQIIIDPEGEFSSLIEPLGLTRLDCAKLDPAALAAAAGRVRKHRLSVLLDLSDVERDDQLMAVAAFLRALMAAPREDWHSALVVIDEAHLFAPLGGDAAAPSSVRKAAIASLVDLMSRGRKRGLCGILATQRIARMAKSVISEATNFLVGMNTLDIDIRRAAETIGWDARRAFDRLPLLEPGNFVAVGPAFTRSPCILHIGPVATPHRGAAPALAAPEVVGAEQAAELLELDALQAATAADQEITEANAPDGARAIRAFIREPGFLLAAKIYGALAQLSPDAAAVAEMAGAFDASDADVEAALSLLDRFNALDFTGGATDRTVRLSRYFR